MPAIRQARPLFLFENFCRKNEVDGVPISALIGDSELELIVLTTPASQEEGFSKYKPTDISGLLFIYTEEQPLNFWMKGVDFPLDIMYFDANRSLVNWTEMQPEEDHKTIYSSDTLAMFAVEVPAGWCKENGITPGCKLKF